MESSEGQEIISNQDQQKSAKDSGEPAQCSGKSTPKGCLSAWRQVEAEAVHHYQAGNYSLAAERYTKCLQQTGIPAASRLGLLHSRSAANLKLKKYSLVLNDCSEILNIESGNIKALARKVKALSGEGKFSEAHKVALQWQALDPTNDQVKKELERLNIILTALQEQDAEEDGMDDCIVITERREPPEGEEAEDDSAPFLIPSIAADAVDAAGSNGAVPSGASNTATGDDSKTPIKEDDDDLYNCKYCDVNFTNNAEFRLHCQSDQHQKTVSSDDGKEWRFRPPPRGLTSDEYSHCPRFFRDGTCRFGDQCSQAHSDEELEEWRKRFEYRRQRLQKAKDSEMMQGSSFAEQLLEKWMSAPNPKLILTDNAEGINIHVNTDLSVTMASKKSASSWTFTVTSKVCIRRVVLLDDANRRYFHIHSITVGPKRAQKAQKIDENCQEWTNPNFVATRCNNEKVYRIKVVFKTDIYGTFRQSIVCDFGSEPMLVRELCVDSSPVVDIDRLQQSLILNEEGRWDLSTKKIVSFEPRPRTLDKSDRDLLEKFPPPMAAKFVISEALVLSDLKKESYRERMHDLLYIEEMAQFSSISKFNIRTSLHLVNRFLLTPSTVSTAKFAVGGELFARMKLNSDLSEDTSQGRLVLQNVSTVYFAPHAENSDAESAAEDPKTIYEALVEEKGKNFIFLRLSAKCVAELNLTADTELAVEVQFQLNRLPLCEMHEAVDLLQNLDVVFPTMNSTDAPIPWNPVKQWNGGLDTRLNLKQKEAIVAITTDIKRHLPPTLIVGPYGTGKTFTLAHAAKCLLEDPTTRVLVCTHSNSAADLYIKEYLDPYVKDGHPDAKPLRVYYRHRWVQTVNPVVLEYCLVGIEGAMGSVFRKPTKDDIESHRIIVCTLSTSRYLFACGLEEGYFTHILLDEAAQAQECETVMPLVLAGPNTRVVLAGDHMQLGPEIHSDFARERNMHISFLERLYDHYPDNHSGKILLCENYRSHVAIINYTSELFYNKKLVASGKQPRHDVFYPLTFFTARGEDMQHQNSTAFYNNSEVYEIVERVVELQKSWPKSWGTLDETSIGVVSPYYDQVIRIRAELRKKKLFSVSVERVLNVQGKQFRAIFLSTVRTRNTCSSDISLEDFMDYGFLSNVKLLNTAITRAQSLVAVVGDPVSLCSVGKCRKLWERFIEICHENTSLYGITWTQLRAQLDGVELKKTYVLNPNAPEFIPNRLRHGPFAPLEPVAMGRYGYTFVSQPQPPQGIMAAPPPWLPKHPYGPQYKHPEVYYRSGRRPVYPVPALTAYMTPMVKVTGSSVHLPGGVPTSLSMPPPTLTMAALKAGSPVVQGKPQGKEKSKTKKAAGDRAASMSPVSDADSQAGASSPSQVPRNSSAASSASKVVPPLSSPVPAVHMRPHFSMSQMPVRPLGGHYRMAYMPAYPGVPPLSPHFSVAPPYGVIYPPYGIKPPAVPGAHAVPPPAQMKPSTGQPRNRSIMVNNSPEGGASGGVPSPYQFLPNACNTQSDPPSAGAAAASESQAAERLPSIVRRLLGKDHQALLNNPFLQRELYYYIHQVEGEEGVLAFLNFLHEQQMKGQSAGGQGDLAPQPVSPQPAATRFSTTTKAKKEVVSVRNSEEVFDSRGNHRSRESTSNCSGNSHHHKDSQVGSWLDFDASSPPFSKLAGHFRKAVGTGKYKVGNDRLHHPPSDNRNHWPNKEKAQCMNAGNDGQESIEPVSDVGQPLAVSDMMKFLEEITDEEVREDPHGSNQHENVTKGPGLGTFPSMRPGPLYMRGSPTTTSVSSPVTQTTMSYAGALRSQLTTSVATQPTTTLTPAQEASRQHLMSLLRCGAPATSDSSGTSAITTSSTSQVRNYPINTSWQHTFGRPPVLPHPEYPHADQSANDTTAGTRESPDNPLDVLKNLHIKASPGTQALYDYFS